MFPLTAKLMDSLCCWTQYVWGQTHTFTVQVLLLRLEFSVRLNWSNSNDDWMEQYLVFLSHSGTIFFGTIHLLHTFIKAKNLRDVNLFLLGLFHATYCLYEGFLRELSALKALKCPLSLWKDQILLGLNPVVLSDAAQPLLSCWNVTRTYTHTQVDSFKLEMIVLKTFLGLVWSLETR